MMLQRSPDTARFRVGTGNPREKELKEEKKREEVGKRRRTIAREGVGEGEREEEREGDMLRGLSPQTKNAGYVHVLILLLLRTLSQPHHTHTHRFNGHFPDKPGLADPPLLIFSLR